MLAVLTIDRWSFIQQCSIVQEVVLIWRCRQYCTYRRWSLCRGAAVEGSTEEGGEPIAVTTVLYKDGLQDRFHLVGTTQR